jgi:hypothetical protein
MRNVTKPITLVNDFRHPDTEFMGDSRNEGLWGEYYNSKKIRTFYERSYKPIRLGKPQISLQSRASE